MGQLHCYVPKAVEEKLRKRAEEAHIPVSRYLARLVEQDVGPVDAWPQGYFDTVFGCMHEEPIERPPQGTTEDREHLY